MLWFALDINAQDIKLLDYAKICAAKKVTAMECNEVKYDGNETITHLSNATFDMNGRISTYTEYFARGRKMAEYHYEYDAVGILIRNTVSIVFNDWKEIEFILNHDANGRLISRELPTTVPSFWQKETYTYSNAGILIKSEQWYDNGGALIAQSHCDYPPTLSHKENSLTYICDERGLLILHQFHNNTGKVEKAWKYAYTTN